MPSTNLFADLDDDWTALATDPAAQRCLTEWRATDPALAPLEDLTAVRDAAHDRRDPAASDRILACFARRSPSDDLAARILLHLLMPGTRALAGRLWWIAESQERASAAVAAVYDRVRTYPFARRPARIAANVLADARQQLVRRARNQQLGEEVPLEGMVEDRLTAPQSTEPSAAEELLALLRWAVTTGHLTRDQVRLIAASRVGDVTAEELGAEVGLSAHSLRRRRQRAERALALAVSGGEAVARMDRAPEPMPAALARIA